MLEVEYVLVLVFLFDDIYGVYVTFRVISSFLRYGLGLGKYDCIVGSFERLAVGIGGFF